MFWVGGKRCLMACVQGRSIKTHKTKPRSLSCHVSLYNVISAGVQLKRLYEPKSYLDDCLCRVWLKCAELFQKSEHKRMPHVLCVWWRGFLTRVCQPVARQLSYYRKWQRFLRSSLCDAIIELLGSFFLHYVEESSFYLLHWRKFRNKGLHVFVRVHKWRRCSTHEKCDECMKTLSETPDEESPKIDFNLLVGWGSGVGDMGLRCTWVMLAVIWRRVNA
jgi:hypothetical protein